MKICVLVSSYDNSGSAEIFREVGDTYQDPSLYVSSHSFTLKNLSKEDGIPQIKAALTEGYDFIWNFLWGTGNSEYADVAGVDAIKYLESTGHPMLGPSSRYLSQSKESLKKAAGLLGTFKVPNWALVGAETDNPPVLNYPLIVKPVNSLGSLNMTKDSVVGCNEELKEQIEILQSKIRRNEGILVEEFIPGEEVSVMVLETKTGTIALHPIIYTFPQGTKETEKWLDFETKFTGIQNDVVTFKLWDGDEKRMRKIQESGIAAYESLGVLGSGYARVDLRVKEDQVYVLEVGWGSLRSMKKRLDYSSRVINYFLIDPPYNLFFQVNHTPAFFAAHGNKYGDDFVIETTFPGGHTALVDTIIASKQRFDFLQSFYAKFAPSYDAYVTGPNAQVLTIWSEIVQDNDFFGKVLDLGCGTGLLGNLIRRKHPSTQLIGVDLSPKMAEKAMSYVKVHVGLMENVLMDQELMGEGFDHVVAVGVFQFLGHNHFKLVVGRSFDLAKKSVTLTIERNEASYQTQLLNLHPSNVTWNHFEEMRQFQPPMGWRLAWKREDGLWTSPTTKQLISGLTVRFERDNRRDAKDV